MKLGDAISKVATPIAKALDMSCVNEQGELRPESKCAQRKDVLNNWGNAAWDYLFSNNKNEGISMDYIVTKQIKVEGVDDVESALKAVIEGKGVTLSMNASPRPVTPAPKPPIGVIGGRSNG